LIARYVDSFGSALRAAPYARYRRKVDPCLLGSAALTRSLHGLHFRVPWWDFRSGNDAESMRIKIHYTGMNVRDRN
jgi:hypothetical protein